MKQHTYFYYMIKSDGSKDFKKRMLIDDRF